MTKSSKNVPDHAPVSDFSQSLTEISQLINEKMPAVKGEHVNYLERTIDGKTTVFLRSSLEHHRLPFFTEDGVDHDVDQVNKIIRSLTVNLIVYKLSQ